MNAENADQDNPRSSAYNSQCNSFAPSRLRVRLVAHVIPALVAAICLLRSDALFSLSPPPPWPVYLPLVANRGQPPAAGHPSTGSPIALSPADGAIWVVNPDSDSVTVINRSNFSDSLQIAVGREPWSLAIAPDGRRVYVVDRADGAVSVIDAVQRTLRATIAVGPEPAAIALSPSGRRAFVTLSSAAALAVIDTRSLTVTTTIALPSLPFAIGITDDGDAHDDDERAYVTHLLATPRPGGSEASDDGHEGRLSVIDLGALTVTTQITLAADVHGFPNLLSSISLQGNRAWIPHVRSAPALPNGQTTQVFAGVSTLDLTTDRDDPAAQLALNDLDIFGSPVNNPAAAIPSPDGRTLYVVLAGSNLVEIVDVSNPDLPRLLQFLPTGQNPRGMAISADGHWGYVMNYLSRSVTVLDLARRAVTAEIPVTGETLAPAVLRGKQLFHSAVDPRLSTGSWISCASCHPDGGADGVTWIFPDGPRQTPPLWNAGQTLPWHWSAALDEAQDVEETIQLIQFGLGLAPGADPPQLGAANAGRSADLDGLAAYLRQGIRTPELALPTTDLALGRQLFVSAGCIACHSGPHWTISALPGLPGSLDPDGDGMVDSVLRSVGTVNLLDVRGATGFDVPSLLNVKLSAPYLHDGSAPTLTTLLLSGHPAPQTGGNGLGREEIEQLAAWLQTIGLRTAAIDGGEQ